MGKRYRERAVGGRLLRELSGTGLGALCEEHSVAPAITVREAECMKCINQGGTAEISVP